MPNARRTDTITSHEAASSVRQLTNTQRSIKWLFIKFYKTGLTDEQLVEHYRRLMHSGDAPMASESGIRTRRSEMTALGVVRDGQEFALTVSNRRAKVWRLA